MLFVICLVLSMFDRTFFPASEKTDMQYWIVFLSAPRVRPPVGRRMPKHWNGTADPSSVACGFKRVARVFERALSEQPNNARLYYWLGKSYARLADVSGPLFALRNARRARRNLEEAFQRDPQNHEYLLELFDFYVDSPEWFHGGLERAAALLELIRTADSDLEPSLMEIADSRKEHSGPRWWMRRAVLWTSGTIGYIVPER